MSLQKSPRYSLHDVCSDLPFSSNEDCTFIAPTANSHINMPGALSDADFDVSCLTKASGLCSKHGQPSSTGLSEGKVYHAFPRNRTSEPQTSAQSKSSEPRDACVKTSDTAEIAFFLKHTGPPTGKKIPSLSTVHSPLRIRRASALTMFKRRRPFKAKTQRSGTSLVVRYGLAYLTAVVRPHHRTFLTADSTTSTEERSPMVSNLHDRLMSDC